LLSEEPALRAEENWGDPPTPSTGIILNARAEGSRVDKTLTCMIHTKKLAGWPIQVRLWLEWGGQTAADWLLADCRPEQAFFPQRRVCPALRAEEIWGDPPTPSTGIILNARAEGSRVDKTLTCMIHTKKLGNVPSVPRLLTLSPSLSS
jgi:hypothetical protein